MTYEKPAVVAQNAASGSYAAGCPANDNGVEWRCKNCERTESCLCTVHSFGQQHSLTNRKGCASRCPQADSGRFFFSFFVEEAIMFIK